MRQSLSAISPLNPDEGSKRCHYVLRYASGNLMGTLSLEKALNEQIPTQHLNRRGFRIFLSGGLDPWTRKLEIWLLRGQTPMQLYLFWVFRWKDHDLEIVAVMGASLSLHVHHRTTSFSCGDECNEYENRSSGKSGENESLIRGSLQLRFNAIKIRKSSPWFADTLEYIHVLRSA